MSVDAILERHGLKKTYPRKTILALFESTDQFLTAEAISDAFKADGHPVPLSTIYRILDQFIEKKLVSEVHLQTSQVRVYERAHTHHAHHLICTECDKIIHVESCPVHAYQDGLADTHGFKVTHHTLNFYGVCEACQRAHS